MTQLSSPGQILAVEGKQRNTKNGQKTVYDISFSDGKKYGTWDAPMAQKANGLIGQTVLLSFKLREANGYTNYDLLDITGTEGAVTSSAASPVQVTTNTSSAPAPVTVAPVDAQHPSGAPAPTGLQGHIHVSAGVPDEKDARIARSVAVKVAVENCNTPDEALILAPRLERYILTGQTVIDAEPSVVPEPAQAGAPADGIEW